MLNYDLNVIRTNTSTDGTHCTGIIGAQDKLIGFTGAAPLANLGMYRIFDCTGSYALDDAIAAILRATQDGCDVLSMSFGDPGGWSAELLSQTASRAVLKAGKIVAISMGNSAREGLWYAQSPQAGRGTIGVGSIDVEKVQGWQASLSTGRKLVRSHFTSDRCVSTEDAQNYIAPINFRAGVALSIYVYCSLDDVDVADLLADTGQVLRRPESANLLVPFRYDIRRECSRRHQWRLRSDHPAKGAP